MMMTTLVKYTGKNRVPVAVQILTRKTLYLLSKFVNVTV